MRMDVRHSQISKTNNYLNDKYKFVWNKWEKNSFKLLSMKFAIFVCPTTIYIILIIILDIRRRKKYW